ncbi:hypothetical protein AGLY_017463 [Aphis glycines]|uniref:Uncharacterized protein n=1 Tax=Aphis glycines TaxID=307491 RepID=A0A6G0SUX8_APHGL|nr:hypothetical protein AGLY_017463 [Aphis glycines]
MVDRNSSFTLKFRVFGRVKTTIPYKNTITQCLIKNAHSILPEVTNVRKSELPSVLFKKIYRCHHNTRPKKTSTPCPKYFTVNLLFAYKLLKMKWNNGEDNENMTFNQHFGASHGEPIIDSLRNARNSLREAFPQSTLLLCIFHAAWRYFWDSHHEPQKEHLEFKNLGSIYELKNTLYHIDLDLGICSCPEGCTEIENGWYGSILKQLQSLSVNTENQIKPNISINCVHTIANEVTMKENYNMENNESETAKECKDTKIHASLLSAIMTFGKYSGLDPTSKKLKLVGNKRIGKQSTTRFRHITEIKLQEGFLSGNSFQNTAMIDGVQSTD